MGPVVIVVVLPLAQLLVKEMDVVADAISVQELVELLGIDAVRALDFAVETSLRRHFGHASFRAGQEELAFTPNFGSISSAQDSRQLQFAARFVF